METETNPSTMTHVTRFHGQVARSSEGSSIARAMTMAPMRMAMTVRLAELLDSRAGLADWHVHAPLQLAGL